MDNNWFPKCSCRVISPSKCYPASTTWNLKMKYCHYQSTWTGAGVRAKTSLVLPIDVHPSKFTAMCVFASLMSLAVLIGDCPATETNDSQSCQTGQTAVQILQDQQCSAVENVNILMRRPIAESQRVQLPCPTHALYSPDSEHFHLLCSLQGSKQFKKKERTNTLQSRPWEVS